MYKRWVAIFLAWIPMGLLGMGSVPDSLGHEFEKLSDTAKIGYLLQQSVAQRGVNPKWGLRLSEYGLHFSQEKQLDYRRADLLMQAGTNLWQLGYLDSALATYQLARQTFEASGDSSGMARTDNNICMVYHDRGYFELALGAGLNSLKYFEPRQDSLRLATIYNSLGNTCNAIDDFIRAEDYYRKSLAIAKARRDMRQCAHTANNLGLVLYTLGRYQEACELYLFALDCYDKIGKPSGTGMTLMNLANLYSVEQRWPEAEGLYHQAIALEETSGNNYMLAICYVSFADYLVRRKDFANAITQGRKALEVGTRVGGLRQLANTHAALSSAFEATGKIDSALIHFKTYKQLNDSIFNDTKARNIAELNLKYETSQKDRKIEQLDHNRRLAQLRTAVLAISMALVLISGLLIFLRQRAIYKREKLIKEKDLAMHAANEARTAAELRAATAETKRLQEESNFKSREITTLALNMIGKNELLASLDAELKQMRKMGNDLGDERLRALGLLLAQNLNSDKERLEIEQYIAEAQQVFFHRLEIKFPELSPKERRLCGMIRQGLSSKEIAAILNLNTNTVEINRHKIRKKLELEGGQDLREFLINL